MRCQRRPDRDPGGASVFPSFLLPAPARPDLVVQHQQGTMNSVPADDYLERRSQG
jgi:hypothetical protein